MEVMGLMLGEFIDATTVSLNAYAHPFDSVMLTRELPSLPQISVSRISCLEVSTRTATHSHGFL